MKINKMLSLLATFSVFLYFGKMYQRGSEHILPSVVMDYPLMGVLILYLEPLYRRISEYRTVRNQAFEKRQGPLSLQRLQIRLAVSMAEDLVPLLIGVYTLVNFCHMSEAFFPKKDERFLRFGLEFVSAKASLKLMVHAIPVARSVGREVEKQLNGVCTVLDH